MTLSDENQLEGPWRLRIAMLMGAHVVGTINVVSVLAMAPVIQRQLDLTATEVGLVMTAYYCGQAICSLPAGAFVDRIGVGRTLIGAMIGIALGTVVVATAPSLTFILLGMLLMGSGYSFTNPSTAKGVYDWFPQRRRATAMGAKQTGVPLGGVIAAGFGALAATIDWRVILGGVVILTLIFGIACMTLTEPQKKPSEVRTSPFAELCELFGDMNYGRFVFSNLLYNFGQGNFFTFLTLFIRDAAMASQEFASLCLGMAQAASAAARFGWGVVSDMLLGGRRKGLVVGIGMVSAILLMMMPFMSEDWPVFAILLIVSGLGITVASYAGLMQTMSVEAVTPRLTGYAVGYNGICTHLGGIIGPPAFGVIVDWTGSYDGGWLLTGAVVAVGVLVVGFGFKTGGNPSP
jgi:ACS family hexuronate transporter-like MFS transporter